MAPDPEPTAEEAAAAAVEPVEGEEREDALVDTVAERDDVITGISPDDDEA